METPLFMVKVSLPSAGGYACCPSGDTEYEEDFNKALKKAVPPGFEVIHPKLLERWPMDSNGMTWVPLRLVDEGKGIAYWMRRAKELEKKLEKIKESL